MLSAGPLNAFSLLSSFTIYYLTERVLRFIISKYFHAPAFQVALRSSRKDSVYWGILLGAVISFIFFPFCAIATHETWFSTKSLISPSDSPLSLSAEICVTSRAVLWVSELNRLDLYPAYVLHHMGSIVMLLFALYHGVVHLLYFPFATLVSEVPGDFVWILSAHRDLESPCPESKVSYLPRGLDKIRKKIQAINFWVYILARVPSIPIMMYCSLVTAQQGSNIFGDSWGHVLLAFTTVILTLYSLWIGAYIKRQLSSLNEEKSDKVRSNVEKLLSTSPQPLIHYSFEHPIHIRFHNGIILTLYGPLMGLGLASLCLIALLLSSSSESIQLLAISLLVIITLAILFARIFSLIFEDTLPVFFRNPVRVFLRPGFWLYGGFFGCGLGLILVRAFGLITDLIALTTAICIALPLYEAISRLGCHTYGCCYGHALSLQEREDHVLLKIFRPVIYTSPSAAAVRLSPNLQNVPLFPIQMISAVLFIIQFVVIWTLTIHLRFLDLTQGAGLALILHALTRLWTESLRSDFRGGDVAVKFSGMEFVLSVTGRIAIAQLLAGVLFVAYGHFYSSNDAASTLLDFSGLQAILLNPWAQACVICVFCLGTVIYGLHRNQIGQGLQA